MRIIYVCLSDRSLKAYRDEASPLKFSTSRRAKIYRVSQMSVALLFFIEYIEIEFEFIYS